MVIKKVAWYQVFMNKCNIKTTVSDLKMAPMAFQGLILYIYTSLIAVASDFNYHCISISLDLFNENIYYIWCFKVN